MNFKKIGLVLLFSVLSFNIFAHGCEGAASCVEIETDTQKIDAGTINYEFYLVDEKNSKLLTEDDLNIQHERILHMFIYDPALKEFQHVHPTFNGSSFNVELTFTKNGNYLVYAQGLLKNGNIEFTAPSTLEVTNGVTANSIASLGEVLIGEESNSVVELRAKNIVAGKSTMPILAFSRLDGSTPELTDWLGAKAHIVATKLGSNELIHVHPMGTGKPNELMVHTTFPTKGEYRLWIQFIDGNVLKTIPLSLEVKK